MIISTNIRLGAISRKTTGEVETLRTERSASIVAAIDVRGPIMALLGNT